ncbi:MAG: hypothetical protein O7F70_00310 [Gemmatimonadetes bacterium]|nr:hypothetical protein [Gemmatimonadota bacterium]
MDFAANSSSFEVARGDRDRVTMLPESVALLSGSIAVVTDPAPVPQFCPV